MERVYFRCDNIEKLSLLCMKAMYEKRKLIYTSEKVVFRVWNEYFSSSKSLKTIQRLLHKLFPQGITLGEIELTQLLDASISFVKENIQTKRKITKYQMQEYSSYVYSKYNDEWEYAAFGMHVEIVRKFTNNFFDNQLEQYSKQSIKDFILNNFKVRGSQLSLSCIADDISDMYGGN